MENLLDFADWLLSPEQPVVDKLPMPSIEEIIYSDKFLPARGIQEQLDCLVRSSKLDKKKGLAR